jgi:hypothetical protein
VTVVQSDLSSRQEKKERHHTKPPSTPIASSK